MDRFLRIIILAISFIVIFVLSINKVQATSNAEQSKPKVQQVNQNKSSTTKKAESLIRARNVKKNKKVIEKTVSTKKIIIKKTSVIPFSKKKNNVNRNKGTPIKTSKKAVIRLTHNAIMHKRIFEKPKRGKIVRKLHVPNIKTGNQF